MKSVPARTVIPLDGRLCVVRGLVEIRLVRKDGAMPLLRLCPPGRWLLPVPLQGAVAVARLPTELAEIGDEEARENDDSHEQCRLLACDVAQMTEIHTESLALQKLAKMLMLYASAFGQARQKASAVLPLTTIELATALGIELRTVTRGLAKLRDGGLVKRESQGVLALLDLEGLAALCT